MSELDALPDGVVLADADGLVTALNGIARRQLGLGPDEGVGLPLREVLALQDTEGNDWWTCQRPYDGLASRTALTEQSWLLPGGEEVLVTARLTRERRGGPVTRTGVVLRSARARERLDRERSDLVATVAHELRSPLTGLRGFVGTLISKWDLLKDEQKKLLLTTVNNDAERLGRLIHELLDVARIDTGRLPLYPRPVDLGEIVQRVLASVSQATSRPLRAEMPDDVPTLVIDPDKATQVVTNLVDNAVRHGEGEVVVRLQSFAQGLLMVVEDQGEGIPPDARRRVFTKFWTQHGASGGSGLGMYIVQGLVRAHGGSVGIDDRPGGGARVSVVWPWPEPDDS